jgi:hypothetical protein
MPNLKQNILADLTDEKQKEIGRKVVEGYEKDLLSRSDFDKNNENSYKLFQGLREPRRIPHLEKPANVCVPLTTVASLQFQARAYDSLIPGREIVRAFPTDGRAVEPASRVTKHFNWQLTDEMEEWEEEMDKGLLMTAILGNAFKKTYYDFVLERNVSELLSSSELIINYSCKNIKKARRITHILHMNQSDLLIREKRGIFINIDKLKDTNEKVRGDFVFDNTLKDVVDEEIGLIKNEPEDDRTILEQHTFLDLNDDGIDEAYIVWVDKETSTPLRITSREYKDPMTGRQMVYNAFTHYYLIPNPESLYGFGFGLLLKHINEASNTILNELIDAGNLNNMQSGFINSRSRGPKGKLDFKRGELKPIDGRTDDLKKDIFLFDFKPPSQALFAVLGLLQDYGKEISSISDAMIGKLPPSDTTATSFMAVLEQGLKLFSVIHKRIHRTFRRECRNLFILNRLYLKERVYFEVQDSTSDEIRSYTSGKLDYLNHINVTPISDPNIVSKAEKVGKATNLYQLVLSNPLMQGNQVAIWEATKNVLIASEVQNWQKYLPELSTMQPQDYTPTEENARFLQEVDSPVLEQQDHLVHMEEHRIFRESQFGQQLTPQGTKLMDAHDREHLANLYLQNQALQQEQAQLGGVPV